MIVRIIRTSQRLLLRKIIRQKNDNKPTEQEQEAIVKRKDSVELMEDNF